MGRRPLFTKAREDLRRLDKKPSSMSDLCEPLEPGRPVIEIKATLSLIFSHVIPINASGRNISYYLSPHLSHTKKKKNHLQGGRGKKDRKKKLTGVGFEPTLLSKLQFLFLEKITNLECSAIDRSAILPLSKISS